jgi:glyoxylase-like metal-dependent hydrolase (beta-lactamase superfamily II)/8-oxo-dGTP pyrophosphatase MutT (NUDIX family)
VLLARGPGSPEIFAVRRSEQLRFFGGFFAFPGGGVHAADDQINLAQNTFQYSALRLPARVVAAARELFEETGVLIARRGTDLPPPHPDLPHFRKEVLAGKLEFGELLTRLGLGVWARDYAYIGSLVTPSFAAVRFDTAFFVVTLPPGQEPEVWPGELDHGRWTTAADLLDSWTRGDSLVSPPTVSLLEAFRGRPVSAVIDGVRPTLQLLEAGAIPPIFFAPAVQMIPLLAPALAPLTHTNAFLVGTGPVYLIDPGATDPDEQRRLFGALDAAAAEGRRVSAVVLTHHHPDHVGAANAVAARHRVPVWAHPWTAERLRGRIEVDRPLNEGDRLDLGPAPGGSGRWHLESLFTPGHAPGHLAFWEPRYRLLFAGDMVSTLSSVIVAPPEGDLTLYLDSLRRLMNFDCRLLLPAHGSPTARARQTLEEAIAHRLKREEQLLVSLASGPRTEAELCDEIYRGLAENMRRFAELQIQAGLLKLQREGRIESTGDGPTRSWRQRVD